MHPARHLISCLFILFCAVPLAGPAQVMDFREMSRRRDESGVSRGEYTFSGTFRTSQAQFAEFQLAHPSVGIRFVVPPDGINQSAPLDSLARRVEGNTAIAFDPFPGFGDTFRLEGMRLIGGRLYSWPPIGPHLLFRAEGGADIHLPTATPATISFDDGSSVPLVSINGALPREGFAETTLYTGSLIAGSMPVTEWPAGMIGVIVRSAVVGVDIHRALVGEGGPVLLQAERVVERGFVRTSADEGILLFRPPLGADLLRRLEGRPVFRLFLDIDNRSRQSGAVVPAGRWVVRHGEAVEGLGDLHFIQNAVAVDFHRRRLMLIAPMDDTRGGAGIPPGQLAEFLASEGYQHAFELPGRVPSLLSPVERGQSLRRAGNIQSRLALVAAPAPASLRVPEVDGELYRLTGIAVEGLQTEFLVNPAARLTDERLTFSPGLDHFWAATVSTGGLATGRNNEPGQNSIRFLLPRPIQVRAMEFVHAEVAGFSPRFNLRHFRVWGRARPQDRWVMLVDVLHDEPVDRERVVLPAVGPLAEIRLEILAPNFLPGGETVRIAEVFFWSTEPAVPR